jgi:hypothetical protein
MEGSTEHTPPRPAPADADPDADASAEAEMHPAAEGREWDADDPRRQHDQFAPPAEPCECWCLHCRRTFMSDQIWFQRIVGRKRDFDGFWMCPTPNCGGAGFTFDIFPTDPAHPANAGWYDDDGEEGDGSDEDDEDWYEDDPDDPFDGPGDGAEAEWDPDEPKYRELDELYAGAEDDDLEGEEWKYGLAPGERPPLSASAEEARRAWEEQERKYDEPDQRPRELDWSDREDSPTFGEDDIPF